VNIKEGLPGFRFSVFFGINLGYKNKYSTYFIKYFISLPLAASF
jgi:hypothetical protein